MDKKVKQKDIDCRRFNSIIAPMLGMLRRKKLVKQLIFWTLLLVIIVAFTLWGAGSYRQDGNEKTEKGIIFGKKVSSAEFQKVYLSCVNDARLRFGEDYDKMLSFLDLNNQAWVKLILLEHAKRNKINAANREVVEEIEQSPLFQKDSKFSQYVYDRIVRYYLNTKPRDFEEQTRNNLIIRKLYTQTTKDVTVSDEEVLANYKRDTESVSIDYLKVSANDFLSAVTITGEELKDYFQNNYADFRKPPAVKIEYLGMDYPAQANDEDRAKIAENFNHMYPIIKNAGEFKNLSLKDITYYETGFFSLDEPFDDINTEEFYSRAASLSRRETSPVIQTPKGVYVLRLIQKRDSYIPELDEVKAEAEEYLRENKAKALAREKAQEYRNKIIEHINNKSASNLKEASKLISLEAVTTAEFKHNEPIPDVGFAGNIQNSAFSLNPGQISGVLDYKNSFFIISPEKFTLIDDAKFQEQKESYRADLLERKKQEKFNALQAELIAKSNLKK